MLRLDIDKYILENYRSKTSRELAKELNCDKKTINNHKKELGLLSNNKILRNQEEYICSQYGKKLAKDIAKELSCSVSFIEKVFREHNLTNTKTQIYSLNENYFDNIDSFDKAYLLGFIASDGCIYCRSNHQKMLSISVNSIDLEILNNFKNNLNTTKPISIDEKTSMANLQITSDILCNSLINIGIIPKKTFDIDFSTIFSNIPNKFIPTFFLGYFDGDGSISLSLDDNKISKSHIRISCPILSAESFKTELEKFNIDSKIYVDNRKYTKSFGELCFTDTIHKYLFLKFIYRDYNNSLLRKKLKAERFYYLVENNITKRKENKDAINNFNTVVLKWEELLGG